VVLAAAGGRDADHSHAGEGGAGNKRGDTAHGDSKKRGWAAAPDRDNVTDVTGTQATCYVAFGRVPMEDGQPDLVDFQELSGRPALFRIVAGTRWA